jgi:hypothetical protein
MLQALVGGICLVIYIGSFTIVATIALTLGEEYRFIIAIASLVNLLAVAGVVGIGVNEYEKNLDYYTRYIKEK